MVAKLLDLFVVLILQMTHLLLLRTLLEHSSARTWFKSHLLSTYRIHRKHLYISLRFIKLKWYPVTYICEFTLQEADFILVIDIESD